MKTEYIEHETYSTVMPTGRLDLNNSQSLEKELLSYIAQNKKHVVFSFINVDYLHSSGIRLIISARNSLEKFGKKIVLCDLNDSVKKIVDFVDLNAIVEIFSDKERAGEFLETLM